MQRTPLSPKREWGRNIKNFCEKLKPKVSHYYGNVGADTCRPPISQPSTCTPAAPAPITCVPAEPQPSTCRPHEHYPSTCRPSPLEKAIGNYEESDKKEIDILAIGLKLFYNLDREVHVHRLYAIDRFVEYIANDTRKKTELNRDTIVEIILKRTIGQ